MNIKRLTADLMRDEGIKLKVYKCPAGFLTIGVGRNLEAKGISNTEAMLMLQNDINDCVVSLGAFDWFNELNDVRQEVVVNMCFNLGLVGLLKFKKMITAIKAKDYIEASKQMKDSAWYNQVGERAKRLARQMEEGEV